MKRILLSLLIIWCSLSAQAQWVNQPTGLTFTGTVYSKCVVNSNIVWATNSANEVIRTTDGGATWSIVSFASATGYVTPVNTGITAIDANTAWITVVETGASTLTSGVFKTTNGDQTWTKQTGAYGADSWANTVYFFNSNEGVTCGDTNGGFFEIYTTNNGGNTWTRVPQSNLPTPAGNNDVGTGGNSFAVNGNIIWVNVGGMRILKSVDKGLSWTAINTGLTPVSGGIPLALAFVDANNGLVSGQGTELRRTVDGGQTWLPVNFTGPLRLFITNVPGTVNTYISTGTGSSYSNDGGNTWISLENSITHTRPVFINPNTGWSGGVNTLHKFTSSILNVKKQTENNYQFVISPNPNSGIFNVVSSSTQPFVLEVYDMIGNKVKQQVGIKFSKNTVDLSGNKKGVYLLHILSDEQRLTKKIVLQ